MDIRQVGTEILVSKFRNELRYFKTAQRIKMREAGNLVKRDVVAQVRSEFPVTRPRGMGSQTQLGPLYKRIRLRIFYTQTDVGARIGPNRLGFYGRFLETGLSGYRRPFPFLEPVATRDEPKVIEILGESYQVFLGWTPQGDGGA